MASEPKKTSELDPVSRMASSDQVLVLVTSGGQNVTGRTTLTDLSGNSSFLPIVATPANSSALDVPAGALLTDGQYLYVATANGVLKRTGLESF